MRCGASSSRKRRFPETNVMQRGEILFGDLGSAADAGRGSERRLPATGAHSPARTSARRSNVVPRSRSNLTALPGTETNAWPKSCWILQNIPRYLLTEQTSLIATERSSASGTAVREAPGHGGAAEPSAGAGSCRPRHPTSRGTRPHVEVPTRGSCSACKQHVMGAGLLAQPFLPRGQSGKVTGL